MTALDWGALAACKDEDPELFFPPGDAEDLGWQDRGLCAQTDPEAFFPEKGGSVRDARKVCAGCEVRAECKDFAIGHPELTGFGIWGGTTERERSRLRAAGRKETRAAA